MKSLKKLLASLLALAMLFALSTAASADEPAAGEYSGKTVILHTNDVHGAVEGYACLAALRDEYAAKGAEVILVDAGDFSQGLVYVGDSRGADAVTMMNAVGYDVAAIGNHDLDYGYEQLAENLKSAEFSVVCANMFDTNGAPLFAANHICTTASGLKIGFFGLQTPEATTKANPAMTRGLQFGVENIWLLAQQQVDAMSDADLVICLSHLGSDPGSHPYNVYDLCKNTAGIDFIIDGHSHHVMTEGADGEPIQSTGTAFANIGVIVIDDASKTIEDHFLYEVTEDSAKDAAVAAEAKAIIDRVDADYGKPFAKSTVSLNGEKAGPGNRDGETNNGDLIADAMRWKIVGIEGGLSVAADHIVAINNGGGIRAWIRPGDISKKDINNVLPFGNTLCVIYVTGAELLEALEASTFCLPDAVGGFPQVSGISYTVDTEKPYDADDTPYPGSTYFGPKSIQRVTINDVNGSAFDPEATYAVVTNDFCAIGGDTYYAFASASAQFDTGIHLDETVMEYITDTLGGVIGEEYAVPQGRITVLAAEETPVPKEAPAPAAEQAETSPASYTVVKGDCLWTIAQQFYGSGAQFGRIAAINGLQQPWLILPGQTLLIPAA